jgi:hypothetical protein
VEAERDRWRSIAQNEYAENEINRDWMKSAEARVKELEAQSATARADALRGAKAAVALCGGLAFQALSAIDALIDKDALPAAQPAPEMEALVEALLFYADDATYETIYERRSCDCCTDIFEPINEDKGAKARAALAAMDKK